MTFLAPALLALGLAATIPLVLHLLQRQRGPRIVFPALRYLQRAEREHATRIRLRQLFLLALRVLAVLLVALAAARPFLPFGGAGHAPTSVVLVLDNSLSSAAVVGEERVLDQLKVAALRSLEAAGPDDRFWLIRAGRWWQPAVTGSPAVVAEAVRRTEPAGGGADLTAELERGASILAAEPGSRAREIHLLSDLQAAGLRTGLQRAGGPPIRVFRPTRTPSVNWAVTAVEAGGGLAPRAGDRSAVAATVAVWRAGNGEPRPDPDPVAGDSVAIRLVLEGVIRAAAVAPAGAAAVLPFAAVEPGLVGGYVEVDADALTGDDRRYFAMEIAPPPTVALTDSLPFVAEALEVLESAGRVRRVAPEAAEIVVAPGAVGADAVRRGAAVLLLPPSSPLELPAANERLAAAGIPLRLGSPRGGEARLDPGEAGLERMLGEARLREAYRLDRVAGAQDTVLLRLRTGEPWAVAGAVEGGGRYVALATPLLPDAGTIPTSAAMLPLLDRALTAWAVGGAERVEHRPGDVVGVSAADAVVLPDGSRQAVTGSLFRLEEPGVYRVLRGADTVGVYAVNPPPEESDLSRLDAAELAERLLPTRDVRVSGSSGWSDAIFHRRLGREATLPLLVALLVLLVVESAVAATGGGRPLTPRSAPLP